MKIVYKIHKGSLLLAAKQSMAFSQPSTFYPQPSTCYPQPLTKTQTPSRNFWLPENIHNLPWNFLFSFSGLNTGNKKSPQPNLDLVSGTLLTVLRDFSQSIHILEIPLIFLLICMVCEWSAFFTMLQGQLFYSADTVHCCMHRSSRNKKQVQ